MSDSTARAGDWWHAVSRWLQYEGEMRAALLRVVLVAAFYGVQLVHHVFFSDRSPVEQNYHRLCTLLACVALFVSLGVILALGRQWLPAALKYVTVSLDILLLSAVAALGKGSQNPMVFALPLMIALAGMRGSLPLVWFATMGSMLSYLGLVGINDEHWFDAYHETPVVEQLVVLVTLAASGTVIGQLLRAHRQISLEMKAREDLLREREQ